MVEDSSRAKTLMEVIPRVMLAIRGQMRVHAKPELTVPQFRVIARLARSRATNSELAEWMGVTAPTMSSMVETLVQAKLVQRESSETDRRQVILGLTKKGDALFGRVASSVQNKLLERLVSLSSEHKKKLDEGLVILKRIFQ